jgi:hypothetical protein
MSPSCCGIEEAFAFIAEGERARRLPLDASPFLFERLQVCLTAFVFAVWMVALFELDYLPRQIADPLSDSHGLSEHRGRQAGP